jgi:hypothetical protein
MKDPRSKNDITYEENHQAANLFDYVLDTIDLLVDDLDNPLTDKFPMLEVLYHDLQELRSRYETIDGNDQKPTKLPIEAPPNL